MNMIRKSMLLVLLSAAVVFFTSAFPSGKTVDPEKVEAAVTATKAASADGKVSYSEMKKIATNLKGEKLTLKERLALKIFGKKIATPLEGPAAKGKSQLAALILSLAIGYLGIHRFYLGYTWQGVVQLLTLGGCGIWAIVDAIRILTGNLKPANGEYAKTL